MSLPLDGILQGSASGRDLPVAIVVSRYHESITSKLLDGAVAAYLARGGRRDDVHVYDAPGAFELPVIVADAAMSQMFAVVVALGCIVKGETSHDQHLASAVTSSLLKVSVETGVPVGLGVLTVDTIEQAEARAGGAHGNKGEEAMGAALDTFETLDRIAERLDGILERAERTMTKTKRPAVKKRPKRSR